MGNSTVATADYGTIITAIGSEKIAACILSGTKLNITHAAVGDGNGAYYKPTPEQEGLLNECWRGEIAFYKVNKENVNILDVKFVVPAEVGGFTIREAALIDADGDVVAICNTPDAQKVAITDGVSFPVTMLMHIVVTDANAVEVTVNSALDTVSNEEMNAAIDGAMAEYANNVGSAILRDITIPAALWAAVDPADPVATQGGYMYVAEVAVDAALKTHFPSLALDIPSLRISSAAGLCPTIETLDGIVRLWAESIPTADLTGNIMLRSENMVDLDTATDEEVKDEIEDIFGEGSSSVVPDGYTVATNEEVATEINGIFGV